MIQFDKLKDYFGIGTIRSCPTTAIQSLPRILLSQHLLASDEASDEGCHQIETRHSLQIRKLSWSPPNSRDYSIQELGKLTKLADICRSGNRYLWAEIKDVGVVRHKPNNISSENTLYRRIYQGMLQKTLPRCMHIHFITRPSFIQSLKGAYL